MERVKMDKIGLTSGALNGTKQIELESVNRLNQHAVNAAKELNFLNGSHTTINFNIDRQSTYKFNNNKLDYTTKEGELCRR
jgi:hypothetical protein